MRVCAGVRQCACVCVCVRALVIWTTRGVDKVPLGPPSVSVVLRVDQCEVNGRVGNTEEDNSAHSLQR